MHCPCIAVVYTSLRRRGCLILKEREGAQPATTEQQRLPGAALHFEAPEGLQESLSLIFSQTIQGTREKVLWGQSASVWEEAPRAVLIFAPQHPPGQFCSEVTGAGWGHLISQRCLDHTWLSRDQQDFLAWLCHAPRAALQLWSLPRDTRN